VTGATVHPACGSVLQLDGLGRDYPGVRALDGVDLCLAAGRIRALVGENGAGKSTLIGVLAGTVRPHRGRVLLAGEAVEFGDAVAARRAGVAVVHQHSHLIPDLSVAENLSLRGAYNLGRTGLIDWSATRRSAAAALHALLPGLDVARPARSLTPVERQLVEIGAALAAHPRILVLDEPTAALPQRQAAQLLDRLRQLAVAGTAILLTTHRLDEVFALADDVTVMRDGRVVWHRPAAETDLDEVVRAMVGRPVEAAVAAAGPRGDAVVLQVRDLEAPHLGCLGASFAIRRGEIYGLYGLMGAGQEGVCQGLFGLTPHGATEMSMGGTDLRRLTPAARAAAGLGYVPTDRLAQGMLPQLSVSENLSLAALPRLARWGWINRAREAAANGELAARLQVRTRGLEQPVAELSGGNQQKVLLGRWLHGAPRVLVLEEPTQGVDVGAKAEIHHIVRSLAAAGTAVLLVSPELPELTSLCHRIGVLAQGRLAGEVEVGGASCATSALEEQLLAMALPISGALPPRAADGRVPDEAAPERVLPGQADSDRASPSISVTDSAVPEGTAANEAGGMRPTRLAFLRQLDRHPREAGLGGFLLAAAVLCAWTTSGFATVQNLTDIAVNYTVLLIGALGVALVILAGSIDISVGAMLGVAAVAAGLADQAHWPIWGTAVVALGGGAAMGALNGALSVWGRVHAIIVTLGTMSLYRGAIIQLTGGRWILNLSPALTGLGVGRVLGIPLVVLCAVAVAAALHLFLSRTRRGREFYAVGSSAAAAEITGIHAARVLPVAFALCGLLLGLAGLLHAARYGQVQTNAGQGFELKAIAAAVIGGTHIMGGRGSVAGTVLGTLLMGLIANILVLWRVSAFWEGVVVGSAILLAVGADALLSGRRGDRS